MIHPDTELRLVSPHVGHGVFARRFLPKGTLVYVADPLEVRIPPDTFDALDPLARTAAERYSYVDPAGVRILSWDIAKYVNHSCEANTLSTWWGFEIAVRDIEPGEELTDEYALFNLEHELECCCGSRRCRGRVSSDPGTLLHRRWDRLVRGALGQLRTVEQPLYGLIGVEERRSLELFLDGRSRYRSVRHLVRPRICVEESVVPRVVPA